MFGSIAAFFLFVPPLWIGTVTLLLMGFMLMFVLGVQVGTQSMLPVDGIAPASADHSPSLERPYGPEVEPLFPKTDRIFNGLRNWSRTCLNGSSAGHPSEIGRTAKWARIAFRKNGVKPS